LVENSTTVKVFPNESALAHTTKRKNVMGRPAKISLSLPLGIEPGQKALERRMHFDRFRREYK